MINYGCKRILHREVSYDHAACIGFLERSDCIPVSYRKALSIKEGSQLVIYSDGENIILKPVVLPSEDKLSAALEKARKYAENEGFTEEDIKAAIKESRNVKKKLS